MAMVLGFLFPHDRVVDVGRGVGNGGAGHIADTAAGGRVHWSHDLLGTMGIACQRGNWSEQPG